MTRTQSHNPTDLSRINLEKKSPEIIDVYVELSKLPPELADKITNAKTSGGRCLNAIHDSNLSHAEKHLLLVLGSEMDFRESFTNKYRFISITTLSKKTSLSKRSIINILNGYENRGKKIKGLIEKGYVNKQLATMEEQMKGWANHYCLTIQIFDEYMLSLIEKSKKYKTDLSTEIPSKPNLRVVQENTGLLDEKEESTFCGRTPPSEGEGMQQLHSPSATVAYPPCNGCTPPRATVAHKSPVFKSPSNTPSCVWKGKSGKTPPHTEKGCSDSRRDDRRESRSEASKSMTNGIPTSLCRTLSDTLRLRQMFNLTFLGNETCAVILSNVLKETSCTPQELLTAIIDLPNHPFDAIFRTKRIDIQTNSQDLSKWVTERDFVIKGYKDKQNESTHQEQADFEELRVLRENRKFSSKRPMRVVP